ncbi:MAG: GDYXXLXY domain-containing protein [Candidatus Thiodiazotropha sp. (ex Myrtea sp. 'scaly one' KF741663)]|nr:GDYXXLXY domain-containing protein [Candidatus Thiodiazotropha sp. (ex Myrtea sp. 'scaly one' KF741663)]
MLKSIVDLSGKTRLVIMAVMTLILLLTINSQIIIKEDIIQNGDTLLLRLAPRDPRSLLQGDYMALRYAMTREVAQAAKSAQIDDGNIIVNRDPTGEASFVSLYEGQQLTETQHLLRFRKRGDSVRLASDAYFFQEGQWETYANARFGELRVSDEGDAVLTGLYDQDRNRLGEALH